MQCLEGGLKEGGSSTFRLPIYKLDVQFESGTLSRDDTLRKDKR